MSENRYALQVSGETLTVALQIFRHTLLMERVRGKVTADPDVVEVWRDGNVWRIEAIFVRCLNGGSDEHVK